MNSYIVVTRAPRARSANNDNGARYQWSWRAYAAIARCRLGGIS